MGRVSLARTAVTLRQRWLSGRPLGRGTRLVSSVLLGVTIVVSGFIVFSPGAPAPAGQSALHRWTSVWRLTGAQPTFLTFDTIEWFANVAMFLPIGFLFAGAVVPRWRFAVVPLAAAGSVFIEVVQLFIPDRVSSVADVVANTAGSLLGVLLLAAVTGRVGAVGTGPRSVMLSR